MTLLTMRSRSVLMDG